VAAIVVVAIALGVRVVEMIVRLRDIHREGSESPFGRVGGERKLEKQEKSYSAPEKCAGMIQGTTLSAREEVWRVIVNIQSSGGGKLKGARRTSRVRESQRRHQV
jgi:hypothetical protein